MSAVIKSDDPNAIAKLQQRIADFESMQAHMKAANKIVRRNGSSNSKVAALVEQCNMTDAEALKLLTPDSCNRYGYPPYMLANNNANIKRMKERVETLQQAPKTRQEFFYCILFLLQVWIKTLYPEIQLLEEPMKGRNRR